VVSTIEAAKYGVREAEVAVENTRIVAAIRWHRVERRMLMSARSSHRSPAPRAPKAAVVTIADMSSLEVDADVSEANHHAGSR
jgi:hypothetical protein